MSHEVRYDQGKHIVRVKIMGALSESETTAAARRDSEVARQHNCKRHLVDLRMGVATESLGRVFMLMTGLEEFGFDRKDRTAMVYGRDAEVHEFAQMVARNRGWHNLRYFRSLEEAETWLLEEE